MPPKCPPAVRAAALRAYGNGVAPTLVSATYDVSETALRAWAQAEGVKPRVPHHLRPKILRAHELMPALSSTDLARQFGLSRAAVKDLLGSTDLDAYTGGWVRRGGILRPVPRKEVA